MEYCDDNIHQGILYVEEQIEGPSLGPDDERTERPLH